MADKRVAFYTLGCKLNYAETIELEKNFLTQGYRSVDFAEAPDVFVINTCSVTENADRDCRRLVREARAIAPRARILVTGCYAQLKPREAAAIPGVTAVVGAHEKFALHILLDQHTSAGAAPTIRAEGFHGQESFRGASALSRRTRGFLKVQDGCDYSCSFCTIPAARGKSRSGDIASLAAQARAMGVQGAKEVVLTGVNVGDFGLQYGKRVHRFMELARTLEEVEEVERFRISSIEPNLATDELIAFIQRSARFAPHFHLPLQSGSNRVLRLMKRRYNRELYARKVDQIKTLIPHSCIGADVIVGFPGEGFAEFEETFRFLESLDVSYLHVFSYSERDHTPAAAMADSVDMAERKRRSAALRQLSDQKKRTFYAAHIGAEARALFERDVKAGKVHGFTANYIRVAAPYDPLLVNAMAAVRLQEIDAKGVMQGALVG